MSRKIIGYIIAKPRQKILPGKEKISRSEAGAWKNFFMKFPEREVFNREFWERKGYTVKEVYIEVTK